MGRGEPYCYNHLKVLIKKTLDFRLLDFRPKYLVLRLVSINLMSIYKKHKEK